MPNPRAVLKRPGLTRKTLQHHAAAQAAAARVAEEMHKLRELVTTLRAANSDLIRAAVTATDRTNRLTSENQQQAAQINALKAQIRAAQAQRQETKQ